MIKHNACTAHLYKKPLPKVHNYKSNCCNTLLLRHRGCHHYTRIPRRSNQSLPLIHYCRLLEPRWRDRCTPPFMRMQSLVQCFFLNTYSKFTLCTTLHLVNSKTVLAYKAPTVKLIRVTAVLLAVVVINHLSVHNELLT